MLIGETTCNLSLAPGPYEDWRGYIKNTIQSELGSDWIVRAWLRLAQSSVCGSKWLSSLEYKKILGNPNLSIWMKNSTGNPSLSTQETQPEDLDEEYSRKPNLWIWMKNIPGNPTCGSRWRIFQETQPVDLDEEYSRKPDLWIWMKNIPGNPTCGSGWRIF